MVDRTCPECGEVFQFPCHLKRHQARKQTCLTPKGVSKKNEASGMFVCPYCSVGFKHQSGLSRHMHNTCPKMPGPSLKASFNAMRPTRTTKTLEKMVRPPPEPQQSAIPEDELEEPAPTLAPSPRPPTEEEIAASQETPTEVFNRKMNDPTRKGRYVCWEDVEFRAAVVRMNRLHEAKAEAEKEGSSPSSNAELLNGGRDLKDLPPVPSYITPIDGQLFDLSKFRPPPETNWSCTVRGRSITFEEAQRAAICDETRVRCTDLKFRCERLDGRTDFKTPHRDAFVLKKHPEFIRGGFEAAFACQHFGMERSIPRKNSPQCPLGVYSAEIAPNDRITEPDELDPETGKSYQYLIGVPLSETGALDWTRVIDPSSRAMRRTPFSPLERAGWMEFARSMTGAVRIAENLSPQCFLRDNPNRGTLRFNFGSTYSIIVE